MAGKTTLRVLQGLALFSAWSLFADACFAVQPADRLKKVLKDWENLQSPRNVRYVAVGRMVWERAFINGMQGGEVPLSPPYAAPHKVTVVLDFANNRARVEESKHALDGKDHQFHPSLTTQVWNDPIFATYRRGADELPGASLPYSEVTIDERSAEPGYGILMAAAFAFLAHGDVPTLDREIQGNSLRIPVKEGVFRLHGRGKHAGKECLVLRATATPQFTGYRQFWIDPTRRNVVLRMADCAGDDFTYRSVDVDYRQSPTGLIPTSARYTQYAGRDTVRFTVELDITEAAFNLDLDPKLFEIELRPGLKVTKPEGSFLTRTFKVAGDGKTLEVEPLPISYDDIPTYNANRIAWWCGLAFGTSCLAILVWLLARLVRGRPSLK